MSPPSIADVGISFFLTEEKEEQKDDQRQEVEESKIDFTKNVRLHLELKK